MNVYICSECGQVFDFDHPTDIGRWRLDLATNIPKEHKCAEQHPQAGHNDVVELSLNELWLALREQGLQPIHFAYADEMKRALGSYVKWVRPVPYDRTCYFEVCIGDGGNVPAVRGYEFHDGYGHADGRVLVYRRLE